MESSGLENVGSNGSAIIAEQTSSNTENSPKYQDFEFKINESAVYGTGVIEASPTTRYKSLILTLINALPSTEEFRDLKYLRVVDLEKRMTKLNSYLSDKVIKSENGLIKRSGALPIEEVINPIFHRLVEENHPVAQLLESVDVDRLSNPNIMRGLIIDIIKLTHRDEIIDAYKNFSRVGSINR